MEWTREREKCEALVEPVASPTAAARTAKEKERWQDREAGEAKARQRGEPFPSYESLLPSSSSSTKDASTKDVLTLKKEVRDLLESRSITIDEHLSDLLGATDPLEDVRQEQKTLNLKKKLLAKMDKLKAKHAEKREAWGKFLDAIEEHRKRKK